MDLDFSTGGITFQPGFVVINKDTYGFDIAFCGNLRLIQGIPHEPHIKRAVKQSFGEA